MTDKELIDLVANAWINNGGDEKGFNWVIPKIQTRIHELETTLEE